MSALLLSKPLPWFGRPLCLALALATGAAPALAQSPAGPAAADSAPSSPALVGHLLRVLEKREQPLGGGWFGAGPASAAETADAERQLRGLGARASAAAPRLAEMLLRTERNAYELAWSLWSVSPEPAPERFAALGITWADATGAARLELLAQLGRTRASQAVALLREAARAADLPQRLIAGIALGYQTDAAAGDEPARVLAAMLKDSEKPARAVAANGLRLLGPRSAAGVPALIDYLRTRDNVYMAASALAAAPTHELLPAQAELEAILAEPRLSDAQKQPTVQLLLRIEQYKAAQPRPGVPPPGPPASLPARPTSAGQQA